MLKIKSVRAGVVPTGFFQGQSAIIITTGGYNFDSVYHKPELEDAPIVPSMDVAQRITQCFYESFNSDHFNVYITGGEPSMWDFGEIIDYINHKYRFNKETLSTLHKTKKIQPTWIVRTDGLKYQNWMKDCEIALAPITRADSLSKVVLQQALSIEMLADVGHYKLWNDIDIRMKRCAKYVIPALVGGDVERYDRNISEAQLATINNDGLRFQLDLGLYLKQE